MSTIQTLYPVGTVTITISPQSVASSANFTAGVESDSISNVGNLDLDHLISGAWTLGGGATDNTQVQIWVVPCLTDDLSSSVTWPDVFDGTASAETVTSAGILQGCGRLGAVLTVDGASSFRSFFCEGLSVAGLFGGVMPTRYVIFITHNTGAVSSAAAGAFLWRYQRFQAAVN